MPTVFNEIPRFEKLNKVQADVLAIENNGFIPLILSENKNCWLTTDMLLTDEHTDHYGLIRDLKLPISNIRLQVPRSVIGRICFQIYSCDDIYHRHIETCFDFGTAIIKMPNDENKILIIQIYQWKGFATFVTSCDFEHLIKLVDFCQNNSRFLFCSFELQNPKPGL